MKVVSSIKDMSKNVKARVDASDEIVVKCKEKTQTCKFNTVFVHNGLKKTDYNLSLNVSQNTTLPQLFDKIIVGIYLGNPSYNWFAILLRAICFLISLVCLIMFLCHFRHCRNQRIRSELRNILTISVSLVLFNDPLFAITTIFPSFFLQIISTVFVTNFYRSLLHFWMMFCWQTKMGVTTDVSKTFTIVSWIISFIFGVVITFQTIVNDSYNVFRAAIPDYPQFAHQLHDHQQCPLRGFNCLRCGHAHNRLYDSAHCLQESLPFAQTIPIHPQIFVLLCCALLPIGFGQNVQSVFL